MYYVQAFSHSLEISYNWSFYVLGYRKSTRHITYPRIDKLLSLTAQQQRELQLRRALYRDLPMETNYIPSYQITSMDAKTYYLR